MFWPLSVSLSLSPSLIFISIPLSPLSVLINELALSELAYVCVRVFVYARGKGSQAQCSPLIKTLFLFQHQRNMDIVYSQTLPWDYCLFLLPS